MTDGATIVTLITIAGALVLAIRGLRSRGQGWNRTALMAVAWAVIIATLAFLLSLS